MTPDEMHEAYYKNKPNGNHDEPSRKTLELLFDLERRVESKLDTKLDHKAFVWIIGILMTVVLGILGIIYSRVENIYDKTNETNNVVSQIQGKLEPFNFIKE